MKLFQISMATYEKITQTIIRFYCFMCFDVFILLLTLYIQFTILFLLFLVHSYPSKSPHTCYSQQQQKQHTTNTLECVMCCAAVCRLWTQTGLAWTLCLATSQTTPPSAEILSISISTHLDGSGPQAGRALMFSEM